MVQGNRTSNLVFNENSLLSRKRLFFCGIIGLAKTKSNMKKYLQFLFVGIFFVLTVPPLAAQEPTGNLNGIITPQIQAQAVQEAQQSTTTRSQNTTAASASSSGTPCNGTVEAGVCFPTNTGLSNAPLGNILMTFMFWLLAIVGMLAIIAFVISGMQYLASVGDAKLAETGKRNMLNAIIGVIVALSGLVILQAIETLLTAQSNTF